MLYKGNNSGNFYGKKGKFTFFLRGTSIVKAVW